MSNKREDWTVLSMLEWATDYFKQNDIPDPRHSIEWLLAEVLDIKRLDLYLKYNRPLSPKELNQLRPLVKRRAQHEPLQHIIGFTDFLNARISVSPDVLIPRIETEQLVEIILDRHSKDPLRLMDIGTGSGCIAIALKMERPEWEVFGSDISEESLQMARHNAEQNGAAITFYQDDILSPDDHQITSPLHVLVSNPPYITLEEKETLEPQVREFEPHHALFTEDLKEMYNSIRNFSEQHLASAGVLYLEIHEDYSEVILDIFDTPRWEARLLKDYDRKPRFIVGQLR